MPELRGREGARPALFSLNKKFQIMVKLSILPIFVLLFIRQVTLMFPFFVIVNRTVFLSIGWDVGPKTNNDAWYRLLEVGRPNRREIPNLQSP